MTQPPSDVTLHLAYAQASVMVLESLLQILVERRVVSMEEITEAIETAIETKRSLVQEGTHPEIASLAAGVLSTMSNSLRATRPLKPEPDSP